MSTDVWSPAKEPKKISEIKSQWLEQFIQYSENDQLELINKLTTAEEQELVAGLMKLELNSWISAVDSYSDEKIIHLIRFFTLAEEKLANCEAGDTSPVIHLAKILKSRGLRIEKELLLWIREHSSNRFLPHGSL